MYDELFSRFTEEFNSWFEDPDIHLSYKDRQRLKDGEYAEVAKDKLPAIKRRIRWIKVNAVIAFFVLVVGGVLTGLSGVLPSAGVGLGLPDTILQDFSLFLFIGFCMGAAALGGMWRMVKLEKQRLFCELVVAYSEEEASEEGGKVAA